MAHSLIGLLAGSVVRCVVQDSKILPPPAAEAKIGSAKILSVNAASLPERYKASLKENALLRTQQVDLEQACAALQSEREQLTKLFAKQQREIQQLEQRLVVRNKERWLAVSNALVEHGLRLFAPARYLKRHEKKLAMQWGMGDIREIHTRYQESQQEMAKLRKAQKVQARAYKKLQATLA